MPRVGDLASIQGGLPTFHLPLVPLSLETLYIILPYSLILAAIGLIESLLTLNVVADMTETKGDASRECLAQGVANTVTGFFGGTGGCAMVKLQRGRGDPDSHRRVGWRHAQRQSSFNSSPHSGLAAGLSNYN